MEKFGVKDIVNFGLERKRKTLAQVFCCDCEISKNTFSCRTPLVAASGLTLTAKSFSAIIVKDIF